MPRTTENIAIASFHSQARSTPVKLIISYLEFVTNMRLKVNCYFDFLRNRLCSLLCTRNLKYSPLHADANKLLPSRTVSKKGGKICYCYVCTVPVVKVLCYKSEGRWFDPRRCQSIFH